MLPLFAHALGNSAVVFNYKQPIHILSPYLINEKPSTATPNTTRITPVAILSERGLALFAIFAAMRANISVNTTQSTKGSISGKPPIAKCETEPVRAVKVIIKTLVPTAVLSS